MNQIVLLYERGSAVAECLADILISSLGQVGYVVYVDRHSRISVEWARSVDEKIRSAETIIAAFSGSALDSEMLQYEIEVANDARLKDRTKRLIFVPIGADSASLGGVGPLVTAQQTAPWEPSSEVAPLIADILEFLTGPDRSTPNQVMLGSVGGGIHGESPYYVKRDADRELQSCLVNGESTTLIKGARQSGKTSLIGQGLDLVRKNGWRSCVTDFQKLGANLYANQDEFYRTLAALLAHQMKVGYGLEWDWEWDDVFGPTANLDEFVRRMAGSREDRIIWFMDEADWLFASSFADGFFALVRSWHNSRALTVEPVWGRFSVVIAYATEAHLLIQDINQSPFNVGQRIELKGFSLRQTEELNARYGEPLRSIDQISQLQELLDGQPFLTRSAFDTLLRTGGNLRALLAAADRDDGPFGDHLRRILVSVTQLSTVRHAVQRALSNEYLRSSPEVDRLVAAGILSKNSAGNHVIRCRLYRRYLEGHMK